MIRIQYNQELRFDNVELVRQFSKELIVQIVHLLHRNIMR